MYYELPLLPVALRQGLPLDLLRELVVEEHVGPIGKIGQDLVEALRALGQRLRAGYAEPVCLLSPRHRRDVCSMA